MRSLYICYFGLREPLVQTQVLPYLRALVSRGVSIHLLTFEPGGRAGWTREEEQGWRRRLAEDGISWQWLTYHRRPSLPATAWDIARGAWRVSRTARRESIDLLHARSHVAAMMAAIAKTFCRARMIFDIRGVLAEEYVDAGHWRREGVLHRLTRRAESWLLSRADGFVVLTESGRELLFPGSGERTVEGKPLEVIPCCIDRSRFEPAADRGRVREELKIPPDARVIVYVGALGGWYLTDAMVRLMVLAAQRDPEVFLMILTQSPSAEIEESFRAAGIDSRRLLIRRVAAADVPRYLTAADLGLSLIRTCNSKRFSSPTKLAEYLASGLPVISTGEIGDVDRFLEEKQVGVIVRGLDRESLLEAISRAEALLQDPLTSDRCRDTAWRGFDLDRIGGSRYFELYGAVLGRGDRRDPSRSTR